LPQEEEKSEKKESLTPIREIINPEIVEEVSSSIV